MMLDPDRRHRRSIRLRGYDYRRAGAYFVTMVTRDRACLFGDVVDGVMCPNDAGRMVQTVWDELPVFYPGVEIDGFAVMPNHIHGIVVITDAVGAGSRVGVDVAVDADGTRAGFKPAPTPNARHALSEIVRALKTFSGRRINAARHTPGVAVWQRNYYEHIIRDQPDLERIRRYIEENPLRWDEDEENPG